MLAIQLRILTPAVTAFPRTEKLLLLLCGYFFVQKESSHENRRTHYRHGACRHFYGA